MFPNSTQTADHDSSQDRLESERQPLIQPQNTYPRFLSSTLDSFQQLYHSPPVPSLKSAERPGKRLREEESPLTLRITEQATTFENSDTRPQKRSKGKAAEQEGATQRVTSLQGAHDFTIKDSAHITNIGVNNVNYGQTFGLDIMERFMDNYVSLNAVHDSPVQDPDRKCHPETRRTVLKQIHDWTDNPDGSESIFWLHGPAGAGKSAIAQTIAHSYGRQKVAATFFFYRSDPSRNDGNRLFTTIAWQLALLIPAVKNHVINSLNERPDLPRKDIETQFQELIVKPFQALTDASSQTQLSTRVIIIDGVDECANPKLQRRFLTVIGNAANDPHFPLRFLICSRPEVHIQEAIDNFQCAPLRLDLAKLDDANHDIEKYLREEFSRIASEQGLDPTWPGEKRIRSFVYKSSGHFVYPSTLIKIIDDENSSATTQLDIVLGLKPHGAKSPFAELDALYMEILKLQPDWDFLNDFLSVLIGHFFPKFNPIDRIQTYAILMNIPEMELCRKLRRMRSLLKLDPYVGVYHQSFLDFLQDSSRSGQYHISQQAADRRMLDLITASIVRHVLIVLEQPNCHEQHFYLLVPLVWSNTLSVEELQEALQPLVHIQAKLLMEKSYWQRLLRCNECNILDIIRELLLHLTCDQETSNYKAVHSVQAAEQGVAEHAGMFGLLTPFVATEVEQVVLENSDLDVCFSSALAYFRETKLESLPGTTITDLMCSLLSFDYVETAMRVRSISDGQVLVDVIDYLINNEDFLSQHSTSIAHRAARLALEVYARVPVLPCSLFCPGDLSRRLILHQGSFESLFMGRILDHNYVLRISWIFEEEGSFMGVYDSMYEDNESIRDWRRRSNLDSVMILRVMLEVAKAIQYVNSMDVLLDNAFDLHNIYLDSECHVKIFPYGSILPLTLLSSEQMHQNNISTLGHTIYELYFDVKYKSYFKDGMLQDPVRPSNREINDELWQVIQRCCAGDPKSRPTIDEVVQEMESWKLD